MNKSKGSWSVVIVSEREDKDLLQTDLRSLVTLFQMYSVNLSQDSDGLEQIKTKTTNLAEKFIQKWKKTQK